MAKRDLKYDRKFKKLILEGLLYNKEAKEFECPYCETSFLGVLSHGKRHIALPSHIRNR